MRGRSLGEAPNYTNAALIMGFVNLLWMLGVVLVTLGLPAVMVAGVALNALINRIARSNER